MKTIAVTGGLGSGKSAAMSVFYEMGANVLHADDIAKRLLQVDPGLILKIKESFGDDCYLDEELQPQILAERAFVTSEKHDLLNRLIHPVLRTYLHKYISATKSVPGTLMVEAAILFEAGFEDLFDMVLLITAEKAIRIQHAKAAGRLHEKDILRRMALQMPEEEKKGRADYIIENNGTEEDLKNACRFFWETIKV